jgi:alpha,alpha-trehalase
VTATDSQFSKRVAGLLTYIRNKWPECVRSHQHDEDTLLGLPYPYTVPCARGSFQELYYWDTYFTNVGLHRQGLHELAKNNTDNICSMVERFGFMLNGSRTFYLNRSQPPYLAMMVKDCYEANPDKKWLAGAYAALTKEYDFWMTRRITPIGLNRYYHCADDDLVRKVFEGCWGIGDRLKIESGSDEENFRTGEHILAECESGWDFNPRFDRRCTDFAPIDLNSNLYLYEIYLAQFAQILGKPSSESADWLAKANIRKQCINRYCWNAELGLFVDYDFRNQKPGPVESLAGFQPLWAGLASERQARAIYERLNFFEYDFGMSTCTLGSRTQCYQWDYPNGWPCLQWIVVDGLDRYGYREAAERIARKYLTAVVTQFEKTGDLWEKYNIVDGTINVANEYEMPKMMGWTAGIAIAFATRLGLGE